MFQFGDLLQVRWDSVHVATPAEEHTVRAGIGSRGLLVFEIAGAQVQSERHLLETLKTELRLPRYFAHNWLSLQYCLTALEETLPRAGGYVLFLTGADHLWQTRKSTAWKLSRAWRDAALVWQDRGKPFHLVYVCDSGDGLDTEMADAVAGALAAEPAG